MTTRPRQAPRGARTLRAPPPKTMRQCPPPRGARAQPWWQGTWTADLSDNVAHQGARRRPPPRGAHTQQRRPDARASTRRHLTPRAMTSRGGAREASPIPSCKGGAGAVPRVPGSPPPIPSCEGGASGIIFLSIYCDDVDKNTSKNVLFSKRGERCKINKKRRSSPHVEIDSTCGDDHQFYE